MKTVLSRVPKSFWISVSAILLCVLAIQLIPSNPLLIDIKNKPNETLKSLPDFSKIENVKEKKKLFFATLYPIIEEENNHVLALRNSVKTLKYKAVLDEDETQWLIDLANFFKLKNEKVNKQFYSELLNRIDFISPSLALTQAAIESGWGTSRFSKQGSNIFGQWCFKKGCGMVPSSRSQGKGHEVATFSSVNASVGAYLRNLNSNQAYTNLRNIRKELRVNQEPTSGIALAKGLLKYSEEGAHYVEKVSDFIRHNNLEKYDILFEEQLNQTL